MRILLVLLLASCATINNDLDPMYNSGFISYQFYDTISEVEKVCGNGNVGCTLCSGSVCKIHSIKEQCVWDHEVDHVFYGQFHGTTSTNCKGRASHDLN